MQVMQDYALDMEVKALGYDAIYSAQQVYNPGTYQVQPLSRGEAPKGVHASFHQRGRWMKVCILMVPPAGCPALLCSARHPLSTQIATCTTAPAS